ncbi:MAG: porin [Pseudomonadota bacterium]
MNKTMLAMAALAAVPFSTYAQSGVTLYGRFNVGAQHLIYADTPTRASSSVTAITSDASLWGMRGTEDLGGGNRVYFKAESGIQLDTGAQSSATQMFNRETFIGLSSPTLGSLQLGSQWAPGLWQSLRADPFQRFGPGGQAYLLQVQRGYTLKYDSAVQYITPKFAGLSGRLYYVPSEGQATGEASAASLDYDNGRLYVGAYLDNNQVPAASVALTGSTVLSRTTSVAATYDFTSVKLYAQAQTNSVNGLPDVKGYLLGVSVPVGVGQIKASYLHKSAPKADASVIGVGYAYPLSKRTSLFGNVAHLTNEGAAAYRFGPALAEQAALGPAGPVAGQNAMSVHVGLMHSF